MGASDSNNLIERAITEIFPRTWTEVMLLILSLAFLLGAYYILPLYSGLDQWIESQKWFTCYPAEPLCNHKEYGDLNITLRIPQWVSDFLTYEVEVTLKNTGTEPFGPTIVALEVTPRGSNTSTPLIIFQENNNERRNDLDFPIIFPNSEVTGIYRLRVARGKDGMQLEPKIYVNGEQIQPEFNVAMTFNRSRALLVWLMQVFLLPPGANWLVGLLALRFAKSERVNNFSKNLLKRACHGFCLWKSWLESVLGAHRRKAEKGETET